MTRAHETVIAKVLADRLACDANFANESVCNDHNHRPKQAGRFSEEFDLQSSGPNRVSPLGLLKAVVLMLAGRLLSLQTGLPLSHCLLTDSR